MFNPNLNFLIDIALLLGGGLYILQLLRFKKDRKSILAKYKPGSLEYEAYDRLLSRRKVIVIVAAFIAVIVKTIFDVINLVHQYGASALNQIVSVSGMGLAIFVVVFVVVNESLKNKR